MTTSTMPPRPKPQFFSPLSASLGRSCRVVGEGEVLDESVRCRWRVERVVLLSGPA